MKKYLIAFLFGMGFMSMQASAASLHLDSFGSSIHETGGTVSSGTLSTSSFWNLTVTGGPAAIDFSFTGSPFALLLGGPSGVSGLSSGSFNTGLYQLIFVGTGSPYAFTAAINENTPSVQTPVPAALWLFGSALMGLLGVGRRKSQSALAA